eukprot:5386893-Lingulodinium_polyedra.AAC.1
MASRSATVGAALWRCAKSLPASFIATACGLSAATTTVCMTMLRTIRSCRELASVSLASRVDNLRQVS